MLSYRDILTWGRVSYRRILKWDPNQPRDESGRFVNVTVGAVKKTKHGAYGKTLGQVVVEVPDDRGESVPMWQERAHAKALPLLQILLPKLKITTEILGTEEVKKKWDRNQPRGPKGSATGGQWVKGVSQGLGSRDPESLARERLGYRPKPAPGMTRESLSQSMADAVLNAPHGEGFRNPPRAANFAPVKAHLASQASTPALESGTVREATRLGDESNANASYLVTLEDGTRAVFKPEAGEAWNLSFTNHDIRRHVTNTNFSLAEREAMASEISRGLGFGDLVPETHLRENLDVPGVEIGEDEESSGGYDSYDARERYDQYKQSIYEGDDYYEDVSNEMERLFEQAKDDHFTDIQNRNEEIADIWNDLVKDRPDQTPYGDVEELQKHPRLPLGTAQSFHRQTLQGVVDPLEVLDEAKVDPSAKLTEAEKDRVREVLQARLKDGYQELGDVDEDAAKEHLDRDQWLEEHQDTEMRIRDSVLEKQIKSFTEWRHDEGLYTEEGGGSSGVKNPKAPHPKGGSLQKFMEGADSYGDLSFEDATQIAVLDYALGSMDRHHQNLLYHNGKPIAIDNGYSMPDSNNVAFRSRPTREWKLRYGPEAEDLSETVRSPMLEALNTTDWQAMADRHPNMNSDEREAFIERIDSLKTALATRDGLFKLWARQNLMA